MHIAAAKGHQNIVKAFLTNKNVDEKYPKNSLGCSPFHLAASNGYEKVVEVFIEHFYKDDDTAVHLKNNTGDSPIHCAAREGQLKVIEVFLRSDKG